MTKLHVPLVPEAPKLNVVPARCSSTPTRQNDKGTPWHPQEKMPRKMPGYARSGQLGQLPGQAEQTVSADSKSGKRRMHTHGMGRGLKDFKWHQQYSSIS